MSDGSLIALALAVLVTVITIATLVFLYVVLPMIEKITRAIKKGWNE